MVTILTLWLMLASGSWLYYRAVVSPSAGAMAYDARQQLKQMYGCPQNVRYERCVQAASKR